MLNSAGDGCVLTGDVPVARAAPHSSSIRPRQQPTRPVCRIFIVHKPSNLPHSGVSQLHCP
eukprot:86396-Chlamydomonas_euryale.AAC.26